jgi:hypothetical protein
MSKPVIERPVPHVKLFMITRRGGPLPPAGEEAGGAPARHRLRLLLARREGAAVGLVLGGDALALAGGKVARHLAQELAALARRQVAQQGARQTLDFGQIVAGHASSAPSVGIARACRHCRSPGGTWPCPA